LLAVKTGDGAVIAFFAQDYDDDGIHNDGFDMSTDQRDTMQK